MMVWDAMLVMTARNRIWEGLTRALNAVLPTIYPTFMSASLINGLTFAVRMM